MFTQAGQEEKAVGMAKTLDLSDESSGEGRANLSKLIAAEEAASGVVANLTKISGQARSIFDTEQHQAGLAGVTAAVAKAQEAAGVLSALPKPEPIVLKALERYETPEEHHLRMLLKETRASASEQRRYLNAQGSLLAEMANSLSAMTGTLTTMVNEQRSTSRWMITIEVVGLALIVATIFLTIITAF